MGEPQPIDRGLGWEILKGLAAAFSITVGGSVVFAALLAPTRLTGASRSARLQWQQRNKEIQEKIDHARQDRDEVLKGKGKEQTSAPDS